MKTIIIHHLQYIWDQGLRDQGTCFEAELEKVYEHLNLNVYDRVIVTNFEAGLNLDVEQNMLGEFYPDVYDYMYGWERSEVESWADRKEGEDFCEGGNHSEVVLLDEWMKDIISDEVYLCGAFDGECIEDMEIALEFLGIEVNRIEELIN